jgi:hypothetical protein
MAISNLALQDLGFLIGDWTIKILPCAEADSIVRGRTRFEWAEGGAFLAMRTNPGPGGPPPSISLIGRDETGDAYRMLYFNERGESRVYNMSFEADTLKIWRSTPRFFQRFEGKLAGNGKICAQVEKCLDGLNWKPDFQIIYQRVE